MEFIADARHLETVNYLGVGRALGIGIDSCEVIGLLDTGAGVERNGIQQFLCGGRNCVIWAGVTRTATSHLRVRYTCHSLHSPKPSSF